MSAYLKTRGVVDELLPFVVFDAVVPAHCCAYAAHGFPADIIIAAACAALAAVLVEDGFAALEPD